MIAAVTCIFQRDADSAVPSAMQIGMVDCAHKR